MYFMDLYFRESERIKEKYMSLIQEYLEALKENSDLKVVIRGMYNDNNAFINNIELVKIVEFGNTIYTTKRQDEVESIYAAEIIQKIIIANLNIVRA